MFLYITGALFSLLIILKYFIIYFPNSGSTVLSRLLDTMNKRDKNMKSISPLVHLCKISLMTISITWLPYQFKYN